MRSTKEITEARTTKKTGRTDEWGWYDLFGWATSGYHDTLDPGNLFYHPMADTNDGTGYGPSSLMTNKNLVGDNAQYDWGVHCAIANAGNRPGLWRTLTSAEWDYLLTGRDNASSLIGFATVYGVCGLILLPDDWDASAVSYTLKVANSSNKKSTYLYSYNKPTNAQWQEMEQAGAVFLPSVGYRDVQTLYEIDNDSYYWTTDACLDGTNGFAGVYCLYFGKYVSTSKTGSIKTAEDNRYYGFAVRLVRD